MTLTLPPLNALRAFEASARLGGYVAAAKELNVSAAAVSQHIRNLEDYLDKRLFTRLNNRVVLTDAGEEIFKNVHHAFEEIAQSTSRAMGTRQQTRLVISSRASVIGRWLVPQMARFAQAHRDFRFEFRIEEDPTEFAREGIDLRVAYGAAASSEMASHLLRNDEVVPLCAPAYLAKRGQITMAGIPDEDLIHTEWGPSFGSLPNWQDWFDRHGHGRRITSIGHQVSHSQLVLDLAELGLGVCLGQKMLAAEAIAQGRLVMLSPQALPLGHAYYLTHPRAKAQKPMLRELLAFLTEAASR